MQTKYTYDKIEELLKPELPPPTGSISLFELMKEIKAKTLHAPKSIWGNEELKGLVEGVDFEISNQFLGINNKWCHTPFTKEELDKEWGGNHETRIVAIPIKKEQPIELPNLSRGEPVDLQKLLKEVLKGGFGKFADFEEDVVTISYIKEVFSRYIKPLK